MGYLNVVIHQITRIMASKYGHKHVKAWHTNVAMYVLTPQIIYEMLIMKSARGSPPKLLSSPYQFFVHLLTPYSEEDRKALQRTQQLVATGQGYFHEQSTQPQTIGYSLADSPVGLLAWIYEKLVVWTDAYEWEDDEGTIDPDIYTDE